MSRWIDADKCITVQLYDDEHEEWSVESMTIAECLNRYTEEGCPSTEPKRPKTTETMMVDGEPTEINPLSYEIGYTQGQFSERPKGEWKYGNGNGECPFCGRERQDGWDNFCGFCGADMRGDEE